MHIQDEEILELLYVRGSFCAPHIAAELGEGVESIDVSVRLIDMRRLGLVEEVRGQPPHWKLTDRGIDAAWRRKALAAG